MGQRERTDDGRYTETVTPDRVLEALATTADPVATTSDVADQLSCTNEAARVKLVRLHEEGRIERRKVGSSAVVWWLADAGSPIEAIAAVDDRSAVEERTPEDIIETHETFIEERDAPEPSASSAKAGMEVGHHDPDVHRHRENVARLIGTDKNEDMDEDE